MLFNYILGPIRDYFNSYKSPFLLCKCIELIWNQKKKKKNIDTSSWDWPICFDTGMPSLNHKTLTVWQLLWITQPTNDSQKFAIALYFPWSNAWKAFITVICIHKYSLKDARSENFRQVLWSHVVDMTLSSYTWQEVNKQAQGIEDFGFKTV